MEKKKMKLWKKILIIIGVIFAIVLIHTVRNMIIINNLSKKLSVYENASNFYIKSISTQGNVIESYNKDNRHLMKLVNTSETGIRSLIRYGDENTENTYMEAKTEFGTNKIAILNSNGLPSFGKITNWLYTENTRQLVLMSLMAHIRSVEQNGKDCYEVTYLYSSNILIPAEGEFALYIEKDTGLTIKNKNGAIVEENGNRIPIIVDYEYKFNVVTDEDLVEPDISEYEIQGNNTTQE